MTQDETRKSIAIEEVGGDPTGANTGLKPGEEPIIPRDADGAPLGNDLAVPDREKLAGEVDASNNRRLRANDKT